MSGTWRGLTENVNSMASNLTDQVRNIAEVTTAVANGDLSKKITVDAKGEILELKETVNTMVDQLNSFAAEVTRVSKEVGTDGGSAGRPRWRTCRAPAQPRESVNFMASNLTDQVRSIMLVTTAVANGDLSKKIAVDAKGEIEAEGDHQHDGRPAQLVRRGGHAWRRRSAPRACSAARPRWPACRARGAASPSR